MKQSRPFLRRFLPLNLIALTAVIAATVISLHGTAPSLAARNLAAFHRTLRIMGREGLVGDPDAGRPTRGKEGPIQSAFGLAYYQRAFPARTVPPSAYPNGVAQYNRVARNVVAGSLGNRGWQQLGPLYAPNANFPNPVTGASTAVSGRVTALAVVPSTCSASGCSTIYVGAANGGVWKTTDGGTTWTPLLDGQPSTAVGAITLDPKNPNIIYVGTGEPNFSCDSNMGAGILRSVNGGRSWTLLGYNQFVNRSIADIIVDPRTAGSTRATLYVGSFNATSNNSTTASCDNTAPGAPALGFYTSTDGGQLWTLSNPSDAQQGIQSLVMDPNDPNVLYAGYTFAGLYKSTDDGATWSALGGGLPTTADNFDRITVAVAPSNPDVVYASYDIAFSHNAFYRSADGGVTWTQQANTPDACDGQCWYDMPLAIDPSDPNTVYAGGSANYGYIFGSQADCATFSPLPTDCNTAMMKSIDGGATWSDVQENGSAGPIHPDDHVIVIAPNNRNVVYTGNDGGVFHSADGATSWNDLNQGLGTLQFQGLAVGPSGDIYAGTQDNGTFKYSGSTTWTHVNGGDGGPTATDPTNANTSYNSYYGAQLFRNDNAGDPNSDTWIAPFYGDYFLSGQGQFYEPYVVAPSSPNTLYYGTYRLWRSLSRGGTDGNNDGDATNDPSDTIDWQPISFDLSCPTQPITPSTICGQATGTFDSIASVAVSPVDPNVVAVGTSNGQLWLTTNALAPVTTDTTCDPRTNSDDASKCNYVSGVTWTRIDNGLPGRFPTSLHFAPHSSTTLLVTFSGFAANTPGQSGHVFVTINQGQSWIDLDGTRLYNTLPDLPANDIAVNTANGHLYVAMDFGVYVSANKGRTWTRIDAGLPNTPVYQMQYNAQNGNLVVATHGRGIWETPAP